jgi:hypothetical protein
MSYEPSSFVQWSWAHPPRCLATVAVTPLKEADISEEDGEFAHFALSCLCGNNTWSIAGYAPEPELLLSPLSIKCCKCHQIAEIFDIEKHGYDSELGHGCYSRRAEGEKVELHCPCCNKSEFHATAVVSYQMEESELDDEETGKAQDLFDTFYLSIVCASCGYKTGVCDYECA